MIDSHCHLDHCADPDSAADPALKAMVTVGTTVERNKRALEFAAKYQNVWASVGIHPNNASDLSDPEVRNVVELQFEEPKVVAVGETGFDTHWQDETLASQYEAFEWHAELASKLRLPLILHVRDRHGSDDASREAVRALREAEYRIGVLHCFNGNEDLLATGLELGWMVSFAGNLTYPSAHSLHAAAREIPEERLLVETDSPFLAPVPHRGKRNTPAYVVHTAEFLARLRGVSLQRIEEITDRNASSFYRLDNGPG